MFAPTPTNSFHGDVALVPLFRHHIAKNEAESLKSGRPICDDVEVVDIRKPGSRDYSTHPALEICVWIPDPVTGDPRPVTYAERFSHQYQQFKASLQQTKRGTPLSEVAFLTEAKRAELRASNIYTVEALAVVDGQELKNLGQSGREWKNAAQAYIDAGARAAPDLQMAAKIEAMAAKMQTLQDDNLALKTRIMANEAEFQEMSVEELREYISARAGEQPLGALNKKSLINLAIKAKLSQQKPEPAVT